MQSIQTNYYIDRLKTCYNEIDAQKVKSYVTEHKYALFFVGSAVLALVTNPYSQTPKFLLDSAVSGALSGAGLQVITTLFGYKGLEDPKIDDKLYFLFSIIILATRYLNPASVPTEVTFILGVHGALKAYRACFGPSADS